MGNLVYMLTLTVWCSAIYLVEGLRRNQGKEFLLSFMEADLSGNNQIYVTTSKDEIVSVQVTSPKWNDLYLNEQFTLTHGQVKIISVSTNFQMKGTGLSTKGIIITATDEVTVYGLSSRSSSTDGFLGLPTTLLGKNYYAVAYFSSGTKPKPEFLIAGIEDGTTVNIQLSNNKNAANVQYNGHVYGPGGTITLVMNRYDTFQVQSDGDLTGSYITSDKPIAFFSGNVFAFTGNYGCGSHLVEQLTPTDTWGNKFAMISTPDSKIGDNFKIIAITSQAAITYSCSFEGTMTSNYLLLNKGGDFSEIFIGPRRYCFLESSNLILVVQFASSYSDDVTQIDPTMIVIPHIGQYAIDYTFTTPISYDQGAFTNFFMFITDSQEVQGLIIDGQPISHKTYNAIPKTNLSGGYFIVQHGSHNVTHICDVVFLGLLYGKSACESYGFPIGFGLTSECKGKLLNFGKFKKEEINGNIKSGEIWQKDGIARKLACADLCLRDCKCRGYTYHKGRQICRGQGKCTSQVNKRTTAEDGFEYWTYI